MGVACWPSPLVAICSQLPPGPGSGPGALEHKGLPELADDPNREAVEALPRVQRVWRRQDLLLVHLQYVNLQLRTDKSPPVIMAQDPARPSYLLVNFPGQHALEQVLASTDITPAGTTDQPSLFSALLAGPTRLVFRFVTPHFEVPFTFRSLFTWLSAALAPSLSAYAGQPPAGGPYPRPPSAPPGPAQTAIEAPWQLIVTPDAQGGWAHSLAPVTHNGWTELWHTAPRRGGDGHGG